MDERPTWAQRLSAERATREWSQAQAVAAIRAHADDRLPDDDNLLRQWKRWEAGETKPGTYYQPLIAKAFGTVTHAFFPKPSRRNGDKELATATGMETFDIVSRLNASDVDHATIEGLRVTVDRLASEYPYAPSAQLLFEGRQWLRRVVGLQAHRLTLSQHREILVLAGWLSLLVGCLEHDMGDVRAAEATRKASLSLGTESGHTAVSGWGHEIKAWMSLTRGDYRGVIAASKAGREIAGAQDVAVQLAAQEAKAWARLGDRRQTELALEEGRRLLEGLPHPENLDNHFAIDPAKYDFYVMDCYRLLKEDQQASLLARQVISSGTDYDGTERVPMRIAEARVTLGVSAARSGDLESAIAFGEQALEGDRKSVPSLLMVSRDLVQTLRDIYPTEQPTREFLGRMESIAEMDSPE